VGLLGILPYVQTLWFGLVNYDDPWLVQTNALLRSPTWTGLTQIWFDLSPEIRLRLGAEYLPVRDMSIMLDWALYDQWFGGFHLTNVLLYGLLCVGVARCIQVWSGDLWLGWIAGLLFALHPLHVEPVAWLSSRKDLLCAVFLLGGALWFRRFTLRPAVISGLLTGLCLVLAVWSKSIGITGVGFLAALLWFSPARKEKEAGGEDGSRGRTWLPWIGWAGVSVAAILAFLPVLMVGNRLVVETEYHGGTLSSTAWLMARVLSVYFKHLLLGGTLGIKYAIPSGEAGVAAGVMGILIASTLIIMAGVGLVKRGSWATAGLGAVCWWIFFLPASQLLFPLQNYLADRYMLLPSLALCLLLAHALCSISHRGLRVLLVVLLAGTTGTLTFMQTRTWASSRALYTQALLANPQNVNAMIQLAALESVAGRLPEAGRWLKRAQRVGPRDSRVMLHQGLLYHRMGREDQAIERLKKAGAVDPLADKARANLAILLSQRGQRRAALVWARQAVRIRELSANNQRTLGVVALDNGLLKEAREAFHRALRLDPDNPTHMYNLGLVTLKSGDKKTAIRWFNRALRGNPHHRAARDILKTLKEEDQVSPKEKR